MKVFTSFLFSALLVVVGGWTVVGMQEGQKAYELHQRSAADLRVVSAERNELADKATGFEARLAQVTEQFLGAQRIIADMGEQLTLAKSQISELEAIRIDHKRLVRDYESMCQTLDRLRTEHSVLAAQ
jgi:hypothetical protein